MPLIILGFLAFIVALFSDFTLAVIMFFVVYAIVDFITLDK